MADDETCPRCGTFAVLESNGFRRVCGPCIPLVRHPAELANGDPIKLLGALVQVLREVGLLSLGVSLLCVTPLVLLQAFGLGRGWLPSALQLVTMSLRFLRVITVGMPIWFVAGVLFVFSPEIGLALGLPQKPTGGQTIFWAYTGVTIGDVLSGLLSHALKNRKRVIAVFLSSVAVSVIALLTVGGRSMGTYYALMAVLGFTTGYWVLFVTTAAEQFGTNLRATVTTSAPNFVRGAAIPITAVWMALKPSLGTIPATMTVGLVCISLGLLALWGMPESSTADLDFVER